MDRENIKAFLRDSLVNFRPLPFTPIKYSGPCVAAPDAAAIVIDSLPSCHWAPGRSTAIRLSGLQSPKKRAKRLDPFLWLQLDLSDGANFTKVLERIHTLGILENSLIFSILESDF